MTTNPHVTPAGPAVPPTPTPDPADPADPRDPVEGPGSGVEVTVDVDTDRDGDGDGEVAAVTVTSVAGGLPPVVAELPRLHRLLRLASEIDRLALGLVEQLAALAEDDQVAMVTGQSVEAWLGWQAGHTRMDRRLLQRAARLLVRLPSLASAVSARQVSWPQLRGLAIELRELPVELDTELDAWLGEAIPALVGVDPDTLVRLARKALDELREQLHPETVDAPVDNRLVLQPRLDGTGGSLHGDLDAVGLAIVDAATAPTRDQLDLGVASARADNLLTRLAAPHPPDNDTGTGAGATLDGAGETGEDGQAGPTGRAGGDRQDGQAGGHGRRALPPVKLLLRAELDTLLGHHAAPAQLLTTLSGGSLRLPAAQARRLVDTVGGQLRTILVEQGAVLGVGRATPVTPGWLTDTLAALHDTCSEPGCRRAVTTCDTDHATPWHPVAPGEPAGTTDLANLAPLCPPTNRGKEAAGWKVTQTAAGTRSWHHPRSGITIRTVPATWRPPGWRGPTRPAGQRGNRATPATSRSGNDPPTG